MEETVNVYVVMGNDYPDAVFTTQELADAYCAKQKQVDLMNGRRIYWRVYPFPVKDSV